MGRFGNERASPRADRVAGRGLDRAERFRLLDEIGEAFRDVPAEELEREVERALTEVRAERRIERNQAPDTRP